MAVDAVRPQTPGSKSGNLVQRLVAFYHQVMVELRKVTWPDVPQVRQATIAIIVFVLVIGLLIWFLDVVLQGVLVKLVPSLFSR